MWEQYVGPGGDATKRASESIKSEVSKAADQVRFTDSFKIIIS